MEKNGKNTKNNEKNNASRRKPEGRTFRNNLAVTDYCFDDIVTNCDSWNENQDHRGRPRVGKELGNRSAEELLHPCPWPEDCKGPEAKEGNVVTVDWTTRYLRSQIVSAAQSNREEEEREKSPLKPSRYPSNHQGMPIHKKNKNPRGHCNPGEPEQASEEIPLTDINMTGVSNLKLNQGPNCNSGVTNQQQRPNFTWKFHIGDARTLPHHDPNNSI